MSYNFHSDADLYFNQQALNSRENLVPFVEPYINLGSNCNILDIGCGNGGVLKPFMEKGCNITGVDLSEERLKTALKFYEQEIRSGRAEFINKNIYDEDVRRNFNGKFDLIILKDAIEHIHEQEKIIGYLKQYLKKGGKIFFAFPPWYNPFGGHQQICENKLLDKLPYFHLLPKPLYIGVLKMFGEKQTTVDDLLEIKSLGISIERFRRIVKRTGYKITHRTHFLINPVYKYKFGLKPRKINRLIDSIPFVRNFFITGVYYLIEVRQE